MVESKDRLFPSETRRHVARLVLVVFLITFIGSRTLVFLIMTRIIPDLFVHLGGTHIHHLNFGIFLLSGIGGYLLFVQPRGRKREIAAMVYGVGLALTFDEFGMWLHLGGGYWQRASFDAITVIGAILALAGFGPSLKDYRGRNMLFLLLVLLFGILFFYMWIRTLRDYGQKMEPRLEQLEQRGPK